MRKIFCTFLVLLLTISLALPTVGVVFAATPEVLFSDDFSGDTLDVVAATSSENSKWRWTSANNSAEGLWAIENGALKMSGTVNGSRKTGIMYAQGGDTWTDYIVEYEFTNEEYMSFSSLYFRCNPAATTGYFLHFVGSSGAVSGLKLFKLAPAQSEVASASTYALSSDVKHTIRIELKGNKIDIYVDDSAQPVITYTDTATPILTGGVAIRNSGDGQYIDNFVVTDNTAEVIEDFVSTPLTGLPVYSTDFDSDDFAADWTKLSGTDWSVVETGTLNSTSQLKVSQSNTNQTMYKLNETLPADYAVAFDLGTEWHTGGYWGFYFKADTVSSSSTGTKVNNGYELYYSATQQKMHLNRVSGTTHTPATDDISINLNNTRCNVKILAYGNNIEVKIDDVTKITYTDANPHTGGTILMRNYVGADFDTHNAYIDNLQIVESELDVVSASIEDGAANVSVDPTITVVFNREPKAEEKATLEVTNADDDVPVLNCVPAFSGNTMTLTFPGSLLYYTEYNVALGDIDIVSFTTEPKPVVITGVSVTKADGSAIGNLKDETSIKVNVTIENYAAERTALVYVAAYANGGYMRGLGVADATLSRPDVTVPVTIADLGFKPTDTNCRLVAFVWNADGSLSPLAPTMSYPAN